MDQHSAIVQQIISSPKGILAADESLASIGKRFKALDIESTEESRRAYRELLFTAPYVDQYLSGVILFDETIRQKTKEGEPFVELLKRRGIIPGIKVDKGLKPLTMFPGERVTEGLDGLGERLKEYLGVGAKFAKWRAAFAIARGHVSDQCIDSNAELLARYAALCQETGLVPIVEPEVLMEGDHDLSQCEDVTNRVLERVFAALFNHRVLLEGIILKPNMIVPGTLSKVSVSHEQVANATIRSLSRTVPAAVQGIVFLSGGQKPQEATSRLNAMNKHPQQPWRLTFSFSRALQEPVMAAWGGDNKKVKEAQQIFLHRVRCASLASKGAYNEQVENEI